MNQAIPAKYLASFNPYKWDASSATYWEDSLRLALIADAKKSDVMRKDGKYSLGRQNRSNGLDPRTVKLRAEILDRLTDKSQTVAELAVPDYSIGQVQVTMRFLESEGMAKRFRGVHLVDTWVKM